MRRRADGQWETAFGSQVAASASGRGVVPAAVVLPGVRGRVARCAAAVRAFVRGFPCVVRQVVGAPDYERYLEHHGRCHAGTEPLDRRAYYAEFVSRRFGPGPTRCC